jgi:NADP-dependent 3-hydroxy acid dehydrogenase YdfG
MDINSKVIIITGASAGIGLETARLFTQNGAKVALIARSGETLAALAGELKGALAIPADLGEIDQIPQVISAVQAHYGRIDGLVNNAGRAFHTPIESADIHLYRKLLDLNVVGVLRLMQCVIPIMRSQGGGVIINISSGLSKRILPGAGPYASTKYALNALTLTAREELAADNIRVGLVIPGRTINTRFGENTFAYIARQQAAQPSGNAAMRVDTPEEVAEKILEAFQSEAAETYTAATRP